MSASTATAERRGALVALVVFAAVGVAYAAFGAGEYTTDFTQLWAVGRGAVVGVSPYDEAALAKLAPPGAEWPVLPWAYPPWTTLLLAPLGLLPLDVAGRCWSLATGAVAVFAALRAFEAGQGAGSKADAEVSPLVAKAVAATLAVLFFPTLGTLVVGQLTGPVVLGAALLATSRSPLLIGVGLGLLAIKPHIGAPVALGYAAFAAVAGERSDRAGWAIGGALGAVGLVGSFAVDPDWSTAWPAALDRLRADPTVADCDTCASLPNTLLAGTGWETAVGLACLAGLALLVFGRRPDLLRDRLSAVAVAALVGLITLPYVRNYDHMLAIVPLAAAWGRVDRVGRLLIVAAWALPWLGLGLSRELGAATCWVAAGLALIAWGWCSPRSDQRSMGAA